MTQSVRERAIKIIRKARDMSLCELCDRPHAMIRCTCGEIYDALVAKGFIGPSPDLSKAVEALKPFVETLENDVSKSEDDGDIFIQSRGGYNRVPLITIGDLRRARSAYEYLTLPSNEKEAG